MAGLLVDEDLPRSLAPLLPASGFAADDVRDVGLRGRPDDEILAYASSRSLGLRTADLGFANLARHLPGTHPGIVVARFPSHLATGALNGAMAQALRALGDEDLGGSVVLIERGRLRVRRRR